jgi:DNA-binding transcriptional MerR regulator
MIYNGIKVVSEETGIHPSTLRRWETLGLIVPGRIYLGDTMVRIYTDEELEMLKRVKALMDDGYRVRPAFDKATAELDEEDRQHE